MPITVKVNASNLQKALEGKSRRLKKLSNETARMLAQEGAEIAKNQFEMALYAGPEEDKDVNVYAYKIRDGQYEIAAFGDAVAFIEYGTGVEGKGTYDGNLPKGYSYDAMRHPKAHVWKAKDHWIFPLDGPVDSMYGVQVFKRYGVTEETVAPTLPPAQEKQVAMLRKNGGKVRYNGKWMNASEYEAFLLSKQKPTTRKTFTSYKDPGYGYTQGNPANHCMYDTLREVADRAKSVAKENLKKL